MTWQQEIFLIRSAQKPLGSAISQRANDMLARFKVHNIDQTGTLKLASLHVDSQQTAHVT